MNMIKLSFIVPIYNVEQYLRKCVDSLLNQDMPLSEYEIILVDDGSPDACPQICDEYAAGHENIRVVHRENGGLSAARNSGIGVAQGEYVCFVDSDDYWVPNVLEGLMAQVEKEQLDVLRFDYQNVNEKSEIFNPNKYPHRVDENSLITDGQTYLDTRMEYACYAWQFIIRREIVNSFTPSIHFEDVEWLPRVMLMAKRVNRSTAIVYNYLMRNGSITQTQGNKEKIRKNTNDEIYVIEQYKNYRTQYPKCGWLYNMQSCMVTSVLTIVAKSLYNERKAYIQRLREENVFPLRIANQGNTYLRRARMINILGANAYCVLMHWYK